MEAVYAQGVSTLGTGRNCYLPNGRAAKCDRLKTIGVSVPPFRCHAPRQARPLAGVDVGSRYPPSDGVDRDAYQLMNALERRS